MPLAGGFVGVVPALSMLDAGFVDGWTRQLTWCLALAYFGVFLAAPLRRRFLFDERLEFPSGTATAKLVEALHAPSSASDKEEEEASRNVKSDMRLLVETFAIGAAYAILAFCAPCASRMPVFGATPARWGWTLCPSPAYLGQGAIMGFRGGIGLLVGAVLGFGVIGPLASSSGWAAGAVDDMHDGPLAYVLWLALALMLGDSLASLALVACGSGSRSDAEEAGALELTVVADDDGGTAAEALSRPDDGLPRAVWVSGLAVSTVVCYAGLREYLAPSETLVAVACAGVVGALAIRALGQTDLNPVSGVGKIAQVVFAFVAPGRVVPNLVAGAVAEAGAAQAGDMMQDLKTGLLLDVSPRAQVVAQLVGSSLSVVYTVAAYRLFVAVDGVPSEALPTPTARVREP